MQDRDVPGCCPTQSWRGIRCGHATQHSALIPTMMPPRWVSRWRSKIAPRPSRWRAQTPRGGPRDTEAARETSVTATTGIRTQFADSCCRPPASSRATCASRARPEPPVESRLHRDHPWISELASFTFRFPSAQRFLTPLAHRHDFIRLAGDPPSTVPGGYSPLTTEFAPTIEP